MSTLQDYLTRTQRLLHDANFKYWTQKTLIDAINDARFRVVGDSGCNRLLQTIYLSGGLEVYTYGGVTGANITAGGTGYTSAPAVSFTGGGGSGAAATAVIAKGAVSQIQVTNAGTGYTSAPAISFSGGGGTGAVALPSILNPLTMDVMNITVLWGSERYIMNRMSFTQFQATIRSWQNYTQWPCYCASYGQNTWYLGPIPDQFYISEWDSIIQPSPLVNLTDSDVRTIEYPYDQCVSYYAAHVAKFQEQSYAEADKFLQIYTQKMMYSRRAVMMRMIPNVYS